MIDIRRKAGYNICRKRFVRQPLSPCERNTAAEISFDYPIPPQHPPTEGSTTMDDNSSKANSGISAVVQEIKSVMDAARDNVARQVNTELLSTYWNIGRII